MAGAPAQNKTKAADLLFRAQLLPKPQHEKIVSLSVSTDQRTEDILVDNDIFSEADLLKALSGIYRTHFVTAQKLSQAEIPRATVQMIPRRVAETLGVFPVLFDPKTSVLSVVTPDPDNAELLREVKLVSGARDVKAFVARPAAVNAAIRKHHGGDPRAFELLDRQALNYDFGQQVTHQGVRNAREIARRNGEGARSGSVPDAEELVIEQRGRPVTGRLAEPAQRRAAAPSAPELAAGPPPPAQEPSALVRLPPTAEQNALTNDTTIELLTVMVSLLENARQELRGHSSQVARLLKRVAERMNLDPDATFAMVFAGHIHDVGKMGQFHLTALNCSEYEGHKIAAQKAYDTPLRLLEAVRLSPGIKNAVFHMYERFDGQGFPDKLVGKEIPLGARLLAVADTYADLTQNPRNPFRKVLSPAEAMNVLMQHKGGIFDPGILDLFKALVLGEDIKNKLLANRYRALIVDPDPEESTVLELRMVEQGFDVKTARTVEAARKALSAEGAEFDLVVAEVELPDSDGLAFLQEARREAWGRDMPWVVHTRKQGRTEAQRAFELGAMDFVAKPVQGDVLVAKLKAMLDQWSTNRGAKGVSGSLREMGLPDMVQVLFHGRKTGKLNIRSSGKTGEIHFLEGNIANAILGELSGSNAFYAMLKFVDGDFALDPSFKPPKRVIEESAESLLLEGMRRMDEGM